MAGHTTTGTCETDAGLALRQQPELRRLKELVESDALGQIGTVRLGVCISSPETGCGADAFAIAGAAAVDAVCWAAGDIDRLAGMENSGKPGSPGKYGVFAGRLKTGAIVHLEISTTEAAGSEYFYYEVAGKKGLTDFDSRRDPEMLLVPTGTGPVAQTRALNTGAERGGSLLKDLLLSADTQTGSSAAALFQSACQAGFGS